MRLNNFILIGLLLMLLVDGYNIFFRYNYYFDIDHFGDRIEIFADTEFPLRSTISVVGEFDCPIKLKHGFNVADVDYEYTFVGLVDTVIYTEFYNGKYELEFKGEECVKELDKLNIRIYNIDFTLLKLLM